MATSKRSFGLKNMLPQPPIIPRGLILLANLVAGLATVNTDGVVYRRSMTGARASQSGVSAFPGRTPNSDGTRKHSRNGWSLTPLAVDSFPSFWGRPRPIEGARPSFESVQRFRVPAEGLVPRISGAIGATATSATTTTALSSRRSQNAWQRPPARLAESKDCRTPCVDDRAHQ